MVDIYINKAAVGGAQKWVTLAGKERLDRTVAALRGRGIQAEITTNRAKGLARLHELIPWVQSHDRCFGHTQGDRVRI